MKCGLWPRKRGRWETWRIHNTHNTGIGRNLDAHTARVFRLETEWGWHFNLYVDRMWGSPGAGAGRDAFPLTQTKLLLCTSLQLASLQPACLPVWICRYFSREERNQMREQVHSYSMCILWFCRFFHSKCSSEVSLVTKPKWVKEVFDSQP